MIKASRSNIQHFRTIQLTEYDPENQEDENELPQLHTVENPNVESGRQSLEIGAFGCGR